MPLNPDRVFRDFRDWLIKESSLSWGQSLKDWTTGIKGCFQKLAKNSGYEPVLTSIDRKEYLVDIVWKCEHPDRYLSLAMESELSKRDDAILEDFEKLVDIKAHLKIGLFHLRTRTAIMPMLDEMKRILNKQQITFNETYLVIFLSYDDSSEKIFISGYDLDVKGITHRIVSEDSFRFPKIQ
ncbi:hypothetical protein MUP01_10435 [Candidatus Bathyarchaeota archaeon]|nr:hypothetical protein [Candidatus Bathyarchaeota archaeon]